jgi:hypothetical protein
VEFSPGVTDRKRENIKGRKIEKRAGKKPLKGG